MTGRWLRWALGVFALSLALYLAAALAGSLAASNTGWREARQGTTIYVVSNGWHTGLILPASADGIDLSLVFRPTDLPDPDGAGDWLLFGWGDRDFYVNTPTWSEFSPRTALVALTGSGASLLHVDHLRRPEEVFDPRPLTLTREGYRRLVRAIVATARVGPEGRPVSRPGYGATDVFYEARGRYSLLRTCNNWTRDVLAEAGVEIGRWTPFSGGVMRWFAAKP
jgi:uncharacterized protein (TIGR02117 family)